MNFFQFFICALFLNEFNSEISNKSPQIINKFNFFNKGGPRETHLMNEREFIALMRQMEKENVMKLKQEKQNRIYRENLVSRIKSSILRDFHTLRFFHKF